MKKGFTLIELLVVVLIIAILSSVALPQYMKSVEKARATEAIELLGTLAKAESAYFLSNDTYTDQLDALGIVLPGIQSTDPTQAETGNFLFKVAAGDEEHVWVDAARQSVSYPYHIWLIMNKAGQVDMCCAEDSIEVDEPSYCDKNTVLGDSEVSKTCKSISNTVSGIIRKEIPQ